MALPRRIDVVSFLQTRQQQDESEPVWTELLELYNKRLWHQITVKLLELAKRPSLTAAQAGGLYENLIADFENKLNPLYLVEIMAHLIRFQSDVAASLAFLEQLKEKVKINQDASILCSILAARIKLDKSDLPGVKAILEEIGPLVDEQTGITPVHGRYFQLSSDYHLLMGNHNEYYREALRYLGCTKLTDENPADLKKRAFALALAALLGDSVFNFGELLQHPIIENLRADYPWLVDLLAAFNQGDLAAYERLAPQWKTQPDLQAHELQLRKKITLLSLMEMTFKSTTGVLAFSEIAAQTHLPINEVELLIMKALSLNLVKGTIDEVDQVVHLTWVQPRVLDKQQITSLRGKLDSWCSEVQAMEKLMEQKAQEILG